MEENPFKAPTDGLSAKRSWPWFAIGLGCGAIGAAVIAAVALFALLNFDHFVDIRENPRRWDEVHAQEETMKEAEKAEQ